VTDTGEDFKISTNQKQEFPMVTMFFAGSICNEKISYKWCYI